MVPRGCLREYLRTWAGRATFTLLGAGSMGLPPMAAAQIKAPPLDCHHPGSCLASESKRKKKNKSNQRERHRKRDNKKDRVKVRKMRQREETVMEEADGLRSRNLSGVSLSTSDN